MPELPEVETLRRELAHKIKGKSLKKIEVNNAKMINVSSLALDKKTRLSKVKSVQRRAKVLILELSNSYNLLIHLKLTGQLVFQPKQGKISSGGHPIRKAESLPNKFTHAIFTFTDGSRLYFNDIRKFGWLRLFSDKDTIKELADFGLEPLSKDFTLNRFKEILKKKSKAKIKQVLLDQSLIAGIG
ncbi:MAG: DNA-formamidopyrimidine glycosylase family protein, partial [bacterium]